MNEELPKLKEELEQRIRELEDKYKPEGEWPEGGDDYWYIFASGNVSGSFWADTTLDKQMLEFGNVFKTKEEAKFEVGRLKVLRELEKMGRPFVDGGDNWGFFLNEKDDLAVNCLLNCRCVYGDYYFDTAEEVEKAINKIGRNRIKKYLFRVE